MKSVLTSGGRNTVEADDQCAMYSDRTDFDRSPTPPATSIFRPQRIRKKKTIVHSAKRPKMSFQGRREFGWIGVEIEKFLFQNSVCTNTFPVRYRPTYLNI